VLSITHNYLISAQYKNRGFKEFGSKESNWAFERGGSPEILDWIIAL
jgi:hypothetical protein